MKSLTTTLEGAQKKAHRLPYVEANVYDYQAGIKRLSWTRMYEGSEPDSRHGIAIDGQELLDVVEIIGERCGVLSKKYRAQAIQAEYDRRKGRYDQVLNLGAP